MTGGCLCGSVRYEIDSPPGRTTHCHCIHCRRSSGAPLVTWVEVPGGSFRWASGSPGFHGSRPGATRGYCRDCGTQLTFHDEAANDIVDVTAGSLDDPAGLTPEDHVWFDRHLPWVCAEDGLPRFRRRKSDC